MGETPTRVLGRPANLRLFPTAEGRSLYLRVEALKIRRLPSTTSRLTYL